MKTAIQAFENTDDIYVWSSNVFIYDTPLLVLG